jgi:glucokinase
MGFRASPAHGMVEGWRMLLCGDIGGTKTTLALIRRERPCSPVRAERYASQEAAGLEELLAKFLGSAPPALEAACFGIAGPVLAGRVETTNLPWCVDAEVLGRRLGSIPVFLLNDLEALAYGVTVLAEDAVAVLRPGRPVPGGALVVIAAGTGLGEAGLVWNGERPLAIPSEGGHADFAPRSEREIALLRYLLGRWDHVSWERVVSGPGLVNIFDFLRDVEGQAMPAALAAAFEAGDDAAAITQAALAGTAPIASAALDLFIELYGAEAGNLALKFKATGGVYLGGGIAPRIVPQLRAGAFARAFLAKGRFADLLAEVPVRVILDVDTALHGAARHAVDRLGGYRPTVPAK